MRTRVLWSGLLISCIVFTTRAHGQTKENPLAVSLVNTSIDLVQIGRDCGWDKSQGDISIERPLLWSSALFRGAIAESKLTLKEATASQALLLHRGYIDERLAVPKHPDWDCKQWQTMWAEMSADLKTLKPLYLDLPSEDDRQHYFREIATNCFFFAIHELDDGRSDAETIARSAFPYCRESISSDLYADQDSRANIVQALAARVLLSRREAKRSAH